MYTSNAVEIFHIISTGKTLTYRCKAPKTCQSDESDIAGTKEKPEFEHTPMSI